MFFFFVEEMCLSGGRKGLSKGKFWELILKLLLCIAMADFSKAWQESADGQLIRVKAQLINVASPAKHRGFPGIGTEC